MGKAWNSVEDGIIKKYYPKEGSRCSARIENRTRSAVKSRAILLGVSCSKAGKKWTPEEDNILRKFYSKELNKTAYRLPGRSEVSVSIRAKILGVRPIAASKTGLCIATGKFWSVRKTWSPKTLWVKRFNKKGWNALKLLMRRIQRPLVSVPLLPFTGTVFSQTIALIVITGD